MGRREYLTSEIHPIQNSCFGKCFSEWVNRDKNTVRPNGFECVILTIVSMIFLNESFIWGKKKLSNKMVVLLDKWKEESEGKVIDKILKLPFTWKILLKIPCLVTNFCYLVCDRMSCYVFDLKSDKWLSLPWEYSW